MKEIRDIIAAYDKAAFAGKKTALATVVWVEGSAYRRAGARMLITEDGELTGAISGGCLEGDALRKARMAMLEQQPILVTYDTMDDDDAKLGVGLGCDGIIHILIEPINAITANPITLLKAAACCNSASVLVTVFNSDDRKALQPGSCFCLSKDQLIKSGSYGLPFGYELLEEAKKVALDQCSAVAHYDNYTAFIEYVKPAISLIVLGAGNDAMPLLKMAAIMDWPSTLVDGRPNYATAERFPWATQISIAKPAQILEKVAVTECTAFVLMTHNYNYEIEFLKNLLPLNPTYIGILGPKKKLDRMLGELEDNGNNITESNLSAIHGPVGLDIGAETAEEIALAITAEIKAVFAERSGNPLKYRSTLIHSYP